MPMTIAAAAQPNLRVGFVGAGRVAQTLAAAFASAGMAVVAASSRSDANRSAIGARCPQIHLSHDAQDVVDRCSLVFLTVGDDAIEPVCSALAWRAGMAAVHCSGATEVEALHAARSAGAQIGGFHPLQMFANPDVALAGLRGCTVGIEAAPPLQATLEALAEAMGCVPLTLPAGVRPLYHASAYYVGPFLIALLQEGAMLWRRFGVDEQQALRALLPLLQGTVAAVRDAGLARGMGGCVARGDLGTVRKHVDALEALDPAAASLYRELALRNIPLGLERGSLAPQRAHEIERLLRDGPARPAAAPISSEL